MDIIVNYFKAALAALLSIFGVKMWEVPQDTMDNLESMYDNITGYEPVVK